VLGAEGGWVAGGGDAEGGGRVGEGGGWRSVEEGSRRLCRAIVGCS